MTDMTTVENEIDDIERGIEQVKEHIAWCQDQLEKYSRMPDGEFRNTYIGKARVALSRYGDEIERMKHRRHELWNYKFHHGQWWKCPNCNTTNSPFRNTCDNCI